MPVTQPMVDLLCAILARNNDLKGSAANQVVRMWRAYFEQFGKFQTTMDEADREVLHITNVKAIQAKINASSREKVLHATVVDKVLLYRGKWPSRMAQWRRPTLPLWIWQPSMQRLRTQLPSCMLRMQADSSHVGSTLCKGWAGDSIRLGCLWKMGGRTPRLSFVNTGIKHAAIAMAYVVARSVHVGIRTLRTQALSISRHAKSTK